METQPTDDTDVAIGRLLNDSSIASSNENDNDSWLLMNSTIATENTFTGSELEPPGAVVGLKKVKFRRTETCPDCFPNQCHCGTSLSIELGNNWEYDSNQLEDESTEECESVSFGSASNITVDENSLIEKSINREESPSPIPPSRFSKRKRSDTSETHNSASPNDAHVAGEQGEEFYSTPFKVNQIRFTPPMSSTPKVNRPTKGRSELGEETDSSITSLVQKLNFLQ